jgi:hypothetical protein
MDMLADSRRRGLDQSFRGPEPTEPSFEYPLEDTPF